MRSVYAMRSCGLGHSSLEKFCGMMNMPQPVTKKNFAAISKKLKEGAKAIAEESMTSAVNDAKEKEGNSGDIGVSVDGTWQKRGFSSLNGIVVAISTSNFKVVDVEAMSRNCKACSSKENLRKIDKVAFDAWKSNHNASCSANYVGSAPGMEAEGAVRIFGRSVEKYGVRYLHYYGDGDGDSKSFEKVENIYPGATVKKFECIGHYQKRLGNRLRKLRSRTKGLGGKNKIKKDPQSRKFQ